jgi:vacuolar-type H+-ATPase subunit H
VKNEVIEKIKDAEARAQEITADAVRQSAASVEAARAAASARMEEAQLQARQIALHAEAENKKIYDMRMDSSREEARGQAKRMVAAADENMKAAVNEIIREIFKKWQ